MNECDEICGDIGESEKPFITQRRAKANDLSWGSWRNELFTAALHFCVIPASGDLCRVCKSEEAVIKCSSCPSLFLCPDCDNDIHSEHPLHDRQTWQNGFYHYLKAEESLSAQKEDIYERYLHVTTLIDILKHLIT